jgi:hypothetical protein
MTHLILSNSFADADCIETYFCNDPQGLFNSLQRSGYKPKLFNRSVSLAHFDTSIWYFLYPCYKKIIQSYQAKFWDEFD